MDIPTSTVTASPATRTSASQANSVLSSDFETFLKMLTAQARYQDPLEPLDSSEYAAQLAQFSMVEQQVMSNDLLTALTRQLGTGNLAQTAGWIGMEALTPAPIYFDGGPVELVPNPAAIADSAFLIVRDENGAEAQRLQIPVSADPIQWAGVQENGAPFAAGLYSFEIESFANGEVILSEPARGYARITEARLQGGEPVLVLEGGSAILASSVTALREPY